MGITEKIDAITEIPPAYRVQAPPAPRSVKIELTGRCNYRCGFCALRTREKQPKDDMDFELFKRITTEMREAGVQEIGMFFLGESMMAPALLVDAIAWCKHELEFPYTFLTTNGSLADPITVEACMQAGLDSLKFSINAADFDQFEAVMGVKRKLYARALENLKLAAYVRGGGEARWLAQWPRPKKYPTGLYASAIAYDGEQGKRMRSLLDEHVLPYVDEFYLLPLYSMGAFATEREAELGYRPTAGNQGRLDNLREPLPCWSAFTEGHVRADGGLSACCFDAGGEWLMGDLATESFMSAWHSDRFQDLRRAHLARDVTATPCEQCVAYAA
jgi:hypothetical protein